jgi:hypothetical protein
MTAKTKKILLTVLFVVLLFFVVRYFLRRRRLNQAAAAAPSPTSSGANGSSGRLFDWNYPLAMGDTAAEVRYLQQFVNQLGYSPRLAEDGKLGPLTAAALAHYKVSLPTTAKTAKEKIYYEYLKQSIPWLP